MQWIVALLSAVLLIASSSLHAGFAVAEWQKRVEAENNIDRLGRLYIEFILEEDPSQSTVLGIHGKGDDATYYDRMLPDASAVRLAANDSGRAFLLAKLESIDADGLSPEDQVDLHILTRKVKLDQFQVQRLGALVNPLNWATTLGEAMSGLLLREYAPLEERLKSFGARCGATAPFLDQVQLLLQPIAVQPPELEKTFTLQRLQGLTADGALYAKTFPDLLAASTLGDTEKAALTDACAGAVSRINAFTTWFNGVVVPRENSDWRLGWELYDQKYDLLMDYPLDQDSLLAVADAWLTEKGEELVTTGREIHDAYLAAEIAQGTVKKAADIDDQQVVRDIFAKLSNDRSTTDTLISDSFAMADSIVSFVREQNLMDLPPTAKLRIEPTPPHLAGNAVAQIQTAPPFEPQLESVWFWDLGLLAGADDYLKEYNRPTLAMVYIHEGIPGHFVQLEYSNRSERVIPKVFWNGPMVEGWASYIATQLVEVGFTVYPDEPWGHQLQQMVDDKLVLRSIINAIIDIRLHRTRWAEESAVKLMMNKGFQEEGEARGKLVRAKLSSVQLTTYFAGQLAISDLLEAYKKMKGANFSYKDFNERLVSAGSPPFFVIEEFMMKRRD